MIIYNSPNESIAPTAVRPRGRPWAAYGHPSHPEIHYRVTSVLCALIRWMGVGVIFGGGPTPDPPKIVFICILRNTVFICFQAELRRDLLQKSIVFSNRPQGNLQPRRQTPAHSHASAPMRANPHPALAQPHHVLERRDAPGAAILQSIV